MYKCDLFTVHYITISELVDRSRPCPNTKDVTHCVLSDLSRTACPLWLVAKVVDQAGGLTVVDADCQHEEVNMYVTGGSSLSDVKSSEPYWHSAK